MYLYSHIIFISSLICAVIFADTGTEDLEHITQLNIRLGKLRKKLEEYNLSAYIIPNDDDHMSEEPAPRDKLREYISGFTGSAGHALVTIHNATLWTDGRYFIQAEQQLPTDSWTLMKTKDATILSMKEWFQENLSEGDIVGVDPKKISPNDWKSLNEFLTQYQIRLRAVENNLIDEIWKDRPGYSKDHLYVHELKYCGERYESKLLRVRDNMTSTKSEALIVTKLDEIAWLFNLRGNDLPHSPQFISYAIITNVSVTLYIESNKITNLMKEHLSNSTAQAQLKPYNEFWHDLTGISKFVSKVFIPTKASYAIYLKFPEKMIYSKASPIIDMKANKNKIEIVNSRKAHIRDAIAICSLFKQMEEEVPKGIYWDEIKVSKVLDTLRKENGEGLYKGPSFRTSAAFGANSALPHYFSTSSTNVKIDEYSSMTLDSGGQYLDGTIDTTRVVHLGTPTMFHKKIYTALLQGVIDLGDTIFPNGINSNFLNILARKPLLKLGLTFTHGTTHGTGIFSNVHEDFNRTYFENFIGSQEPGYYKKGVFGMRLENLIVVEKADVQNELNPETLLSFSPLTLVPYELKLIEINTLDFRQKSWINNYHKLVRQQVGDKMINKGKRDLYEWLLQKTKPIIKDY